MRAVPRQPAATQRDCSGHALQRTVAQTGAVVQTWRADHAGIADGRADGGSLASAGWRLDDRACALAPLAAVAARIQSGGSAGACTWPPHWPRSGGRCAAPHACHAHARRPRQARAAQSAGGGNCCQPCACGVYQGEVDHSGRRCSDQRRHYGCLHHRAEEIRGAASADRLLRPRDGRWWSSIAPPGKRNARGLIPGRPRDETIGIRLTAMMATPSTPSGSCPSSCVEVPGANRHSPPPEPGVLATPLFGGQPEGCNNAGFSIAARLCKGR